MTPLIDQLRRLFDRATQGEWFLGHDRHSNPLIKSGDTRVIIDSEAYAGDLDLIVEMHRAVPKLIDALERAVAERTEVKDQRDRDWTAHASEVTSLITEFRTQLEVRDECIARLQSQVDRYEAISAKAIPLLDERERMVPVVAAATQFVRHRFYQPLADAVAKYAAWGKGGN